MCCCFHVIDCISCELPENVDHVLFVECHVMEHEMTWEELQSQLLQGRIYCGPPSSTWTHSVSRELSELTTHWCNTVYSILQVFSLGTQYLTLVNFHLVGRMMPVRMLSSEFSSHPICKLVIFLIISNKAHLIGFGEDGLWGDSWFQSLVDSLVT